MHTIDNQFEIGDKCYTAMRMPVFHCCNVCEGDGHFVHNGITINCPQCKGSGKLHNPKEYVYRPFMVEVKSIHASIQKQDCTIRYKVTCVDNNKVKINRRTETNLFATAEAAQENCNLLNQARESI